MADELHVFMIALLNTEENEPDLEYRLHLAGCDDALRGHRAGCILLEFHRNGSCLDELIGIAIDDLEDVGYTPRLAQFLPNNKDL